MRTVAKGVKGGSIHQKYAILVATRVKGTSYIKICETCSNGNEGHHTVELGASYGDESEE
jgi:hypothetical protein